MSVLDVVKGRKKTPEVEPKPTDLQARLDELDATRDPVVVSLRQQEPEVCRRCVEQAGTVERLKAKLADTEAHVRTRRQLLAETFTSEREQELDKAKAETARVREETEEAIALNEALADRRYQLRTEIRDAEAAAHERSREAILDLARDNVSRRDQLHRHLEELVSQTLQIRAALEQSCPEVPLLSTYGHVAAFRRPAFKSAWDVVLGIGEGNPLTCIQRLFRHDPHAVSGGTLGAWREVGRDNDFLPLTAEDKARRDQQRKQKADDLVRNALQESALKAHLSRVFGERDRRGDDAK